MAIVNLPDRKLANLIAMVMAYVCFIWGLGTTVCLITPNFHQSVGSVQCSAVFSSRFTYAAVPCQPLGFDGSIVLNTCDSELSRVA